MDCAGRAKRRRRFRMVGRVIESGVALRLPPQSKNGRLKFQQIIHRFIVQPACTWRHVHGERTNGINSSPNW